MQSLELKSPCFYVLLDFIFQAVCRSTGVSSMPAGQAAKQRQWSCNLSGGDQAREEVGMKGSRDEKKVGSMEGGT